MDIHLEEITIRDLVKGYEDNEEEGVVGYNGKLDIRPKYQREFVYKDKQRNAVIETVKKGFPLNVMYWVVKDDGSYEVLDGQQRTISICSFVNGDFSVDGKYFHNFQPDEVEDFLNYKLMVYFCEGKDSEKLAWFKTINIAGEKLYDQELRNAIFTGEWLTDAKRHFSKRGCAAIGIASDYINGSAIRQDYLQTAISWISNGAIEDYMAKHQHDPNCNELWLYFKSVIDWVVVTFPKYRKEMKGVDWGGLYRDFKDKSYNIKDLEKEVSSLMADDDVTNKKGIYEYVLRREEKHLNIRAFLPSMKRSAYERQKGICPHCGKHFEFNEMEGDHITPWHSGGKTISENCQMLCLDCNRKKGGK